MRSTNIGIDNTLYNKTVEMFTIEVVLVVYVRSLDRYVATINRRYHIGNVTFHRKTVYFLLQIRSCGWEFYKITLKSTELLDEFMASFDN